MYDQENMPENSARKKVLVADDERVIADTLSMILNQSGFEARAVYSGEKALELAASFVPDMLISDVIMARRPRLTCSKRREPRAMSSRYWPSPCIRRTC